MTDPYPRRPGPLLILLALVAAVLVASVAGLAVRGGASTWTATALVSVDEPRAVAAAGDGGVLDKLSRVRLKYLGLVPTDLLAVPVAARLGVPVTQVRGRLSGAALPLDLLLRLSCSDSGPAPARRCADALAAAMVDFTAHEQQAQGIPADQRLVMTQVQQAGPASRTGPHRSRTAGIALLAGLLAAGTVLVVGTRLRR